MAAKDTDAGTVTVEVKYYFKDSSGSSQIKVEKRATEIIMYSKHKLSLSLSFSLSHSPPLPYLSLCVWVCALAFMCVCVCVKINYSPVCCLQKRHQKILSRVLLAEETPEDIVPCVVCRRGT